MTPDIATAGQALRTPRSAGIAGVIFSVLLTVSLVLIRTAIPATPREAGTWVSNGPLRTSVLLALNLVPFAGIAFLWFVGVVRDRMGEREDRFFATVFLGSGLLFVAMLFVATALAGGLAAAYNSTSGVLLRSPAWQLGREVSYALVTTYAMRMAAVFMISTTTISLRIRFMPRWLEIGGLAGAFVLLVTVGYTPWVELLFPIWVLLVSVHSLTVARHVPRQSPTGRTPAATA